MADPTTTPAAAGTPTTPAPADAVVNPKLLIPKKDGPLAEVGRLVAEAWGLETWFTLRWKTQADFAQLAADFGAAIADKRAAATARTPQSQRLQELDDEFDEGLRFLKKYINEDSNYDKARSDARLPGFGLVAQKKRGFGLSDDREERLKALRDLLLPSLATAAFAARPYGTLYWDKRVVEYKGLLDKTAGLAGTVSKSVGQKDAAKQELRKVLQAVVYALKANYPDAFEAELRAWGFRKESY
jgi:hypothetical protein